VNTNVKEPHKVLSPLFLLPPVSF